MSDAKREAWGLRANELEAKGVEFPESERLAWEQLYGDARMHMRASVSATAAALKAYEESKKPTQGELGFGKGSR
jgi:hypothetical protein